MLESYKANWIPNLKLNKKKAATNADNVELNSVAETEEKDQPNRQPESSKRHNDENIEDLLSGLTESPTKKSRENSNATMIHNSPLSPASKPIQHQLVLHWMK